MGGECTNTGKKPSEKLFAPYTVKNKKCPCWWDLSKVNCACCKGENVMQCGWPMHKYCYQKSKIGCPGLCNNKYTLSGKGFPCYNDKSKGNSCRVHQGSLPVLRRRHHRARQCRGEQVHREHQKGQKTLCECPGRLQAHHRGLSRRQVPVPGEGEGEELQSVRLP